jgi:hypothetical protein
MSPNAINIIPASRAPNAPHRTRSEEDIPAPFFAFLYKGMMPPGEVQHMPTEEGVFTEVRGIGILRSSRVMCSRKLSVVKCS